jgi:hypothetical protein
MAGVGALWPAMGSSPERGRGRGSRGRAAGWRHGEREGLPWGGAARSSWLLGATFRIVLVLNVRRKQQAGRRRRGGKREEKEKEGKRKKNENFSELENFRGEK